MKLNEINQPKIKLYCISESLINEDKLFLESIIDENVKDVAKKALDIGTKALKDLTARGVTAVPKVVKFLNSPYGRIALGLAMNLAAAGLASGSEGSEVLTNIGGADGHDKAVDAIQHLVDQNDLPDKLIHNIKGDGGDTTPQPSPNVTPDTTPGTGSDIKGEDVTPPNESEVLQKTIDAQKTELKNILRASSRLGNTNLEVSEARINRAIDSIMNSDPKNIKATAQNSFKYIQSNYNLEEQDLANKVKDVLLNAVKLKMKSIKK
jgi:hypothetical protein